MNYNPSHHIHVPKRGAPDVMSWTKASSIPPAPGEVRIRVEATGVSGYDLMIRRHWFFGFTKPPYTPGEDVVGIVDQLGEGVTKFKIGQRVAGWTFGQGGGYSEFLNRPSDTLVLVPEGLNPTIAAAIITNYLTASLALHKTAKVRPGETVLIHGAAGGVGSALMQLGKLANLELFGTGSKKATQFISDNGGIAINYKTEDFVDRVRDLTENGVDVVIDLVGGPRQLWRSSQCVKRGGQLMMLGMGSIYKSSVSVIPLSLLTMGVIALYPNGIHLPMSPSMLSFPAQNLDWYNKTLTKLLEKANAGLLEPAIAAEIPMHDAAKAHKLLEAGGLVGKIVLTT